MFTILCFLTILICGIRPENVLMTEVFEIEIDPPMFNWTYEGIKITLFISSNVVAFLLEEGYESITSRKKCR